ncbi:MAG: hypothetical protein J6A01_03405 [Proteobacteria bacterium]|nr:hypothetical protein [Pseudomonadota bacterium]
MKNISALIQQADQIAQTSPDEAAKFLAPYRKSACEALHDNPMVLSDLIDIATTQMNYLLDAQMPDKSLGIAQWFLHTLHHLEESMQTAEYLSIKRAMREPFSRFFRTYAKIQRELGQIEEMRLAMRSAMDLTRELPMAIVSMLHLYAPLMKHDMLEDDPPKEWLLKRCAEALAGLDFNGMHDLPFRDALDHGQYIIRNPDDRCESESHLNDLCAHFPDDLALNTLVMLLKHAYFPIWGTR